MRSPGRKNLLPVPGIHEDCHRAVIDQGNLHIRTEFPALHPASQQCGQLLLEPFVEGNGMVGLRGADEGGPVALFSGSVQRELG